MKRGVAIIFLLLVASLSLISAEISVSPASFSKNINEISSFTVTITNTDSNITKVVITLPAGLNFVAGTDSTDSLSTFESISNALKWENSSAGGYVIGNSSVAGDNTKYFSFNANATSIGSFNMTIETTLINGSTFEYGIALTVSDSSVPTAILVSPASNAEDTDGVLVFECSAVDDSSLKSLSLHVWKNNSEIHTNTLNISGTSNQTSFDYTFNEDGTYKWNCLVNDASGNFDWASNRTLMISAGLTACVADWDCTAWSICDDEQQTRVCNDSNSCGNNSTKPDESQECACVQNWDCSPWFPEECPRNETQTRTCTDSNSCGVNTGKPGERQSCDYKGNSILFFVILIILLISGGAAGIIFYLKGKSPSNYVDNQQTGNSYAPPDTSAQKYTYKY